MGKAIVERDPIIFIDCTSTICTGLNTGIQRVVRALANQTEVFTEKLGISCMPVFRQFNAFYRADVTLSPAQETQIDNVPVDFCYRDIYFCPDAFWCSDIYRWYPYIRDRGVSVATLIHDLLPISHLHFFSAVATSSFETALLDVIQRSHLLPCVSRSTQEILLEYCHAKGLALSKVDCPVVPQAPGMPASLFTGQIMDNGFLPASFFLMVGTVELRRGYIEALQEYSIYREAGGKTELVIVGNLGDNSHKVTCHLEAAGPSLTWLRDISDNDLASAYKYADAIICPSHAEGYGMSVAEGLVFNGLVLANRLPVFGEFAGAHPYYFDINQKGDLARLMAQVKELKRPKNQLDLGCWENSAGAIATQLAQIGLFHGKQTAIELDKNSKEAVRWAHWLLFKRPCSPESITMWLQYPTVAEMYAAMQVEARENACSPISF